MKISERKNVTEKAREAIKNIIFSIENKLDMLELVTISNEFNCKYDIGERDYIFARKAKMMIKQNKIYFMFALKNGLGEIYYKDPCPLNSNRIYRWDFQQFVEALEDLTDKYNLSVKRVDKELMDGIQLLKKIKITKMKK